MHLIAEVHCLKATKITFLGSHFDAQGFTKEWFHWKTLQTYQNRSQCFIEQYSQIKDSESGLKHLNGSKMLKENMADNAGIRAAYYAYKEKEKSVWNVQVVLAPTRMISCFS
jgi:predicted metalloendopeptidase